VEETVLHAGVTPFRTTCEPTDETCNAIDDDCDGVIDEGCGYESGGIQITIGWDSPADIDLYVRDPSGERVYYNKEAQRSPAGGFLDHDARGECRPEQEHPRIENAFWPSPAPKGEYVVELHYFGPCGDVVETHVTVSVAVQGEVAGVYRYTLQPEEKVEAVTFEVR
jgi:tRNA (guanosine-2'-O-)-methyltransferase